MPVYKIVTPSWWYEIEVEKISLLCSILMDNDMGWHLVDNQLHVWEESANEEAIKSGLLKSLEQAGFDVDPKLEGWGAHKTLVQQIVSVMDASAKSKSVTSTKSPPITAEKSLLTTTIPKNTKKEKPILAAIRKLREENLPQNVDLKRNEVEWKNVLEDARRKKF
jgi:hypothetical protein